MNTIEDKQIFYIDSNKRLLGNNGNFSIKLPIDRNADYDMVVVLEASIPKTYYLIQKDQNYFYLEENGIQVMITIPEGNYTRPAFRALLNALLVKLSPNGIEYKITEDNTLIGPETGKFTYMVSGNGNIQPRFIFESYINEQMGFSPASINEFVDGKLRSNNVVNFSKEATLFLHSDICQNSTSDNILQEIYTAGEPNYSYIKYQCEQFEPYAKPFNSKSDTFTFYLTDEKDQLLFLNGINMNFTLMVYETNKLSKILEKYINLKTID